MSVYRSEQLRSLQAMQYRELTPADLRALAIAATQDEDERQSKRASESASEHGRSATVGSRGSLSARTPIFQSSAGLPARAGHIAKGTCSYWASCARATQQLRMQWVGAELFLTC